MSILEQIRADSLQARKAGDKLKASLLITLLAEVQNVGKNAGNRETTDEETQAVIKKFIKGANQILEADASPEAKQKSLIEVDILTSYLPSQLTEADIATIVNALKLSGNYPDMKSIMQHFKVCYTGRYDGAVVSRMAR